MNASGRAHTPFVRRRTEGCRPAEQSSGRRRASTRSSISRSTTPAPARSRSSWWPPACATPTTTSPPATSRSASTRSPAATRAPASSPRPRPNHKGIKEGDHVVFSFLPSCGHCRWCASGQQNLCDLGAGLLAGSRWEDPTDFRLKLAGTDTPVGQMCGISTFVRDHHGLGRLGGQGRQRPAAGQGLPARLQRRHRLGLRGQLRPGPARSHGDRHGHRRHRHQRRAGCRARRRRPTSSPSTRWR